VVASGAWIRALCRRELCLAVRDGGEATRLLVPATRFRNRNEFTMRHINPGPGAQPAVRGPLTARQDLSAPANVARERLCCVFLP